MAPLKRTFRLCIYAQRRIVFMCLFTSEIVIRIENPKTDQAWCPFARFEFLADNLEGSGEKGVKLRWVGLKGVIDSLAVLEYNECGHATNIEFFAEILKDVDIDFTEIYILELIRGGMPKLLAASCQ